MFHTLPPTLIDHPDELVPFVTRRTAGFILVGFLLGTRLVMLLGGVKDLLQGVIAVVLVLLCVLLAGGLAFVRVQGRRPEQWLAPLWCYFSRPRRCRPWPARGWRDSTAEWLFVEDVEAPEETEDADWS